MARHTEPRRLKRKAEKDLDSFYLEEFANDLADQSCQTLPKSLVRSQVPRFSMRRDSDSAYATEDFNGDFAPDCEQEDGCLVALTRDSDTDSDNDSDSCVEYFDYGISEAEVLQSKYPTELVDYALHRTDVAPEVWRIITGAKEEPDSEEILKTKLAQWSVSFPKIPRNAIDSLLHILNDHGHPDLPLCAKTLLKTPRCVDKHIRIVAGGQFWYRGILEGLLTQLNEEYLKSITNDDVEIDIFVDGISPYKSVKRHLWPIAGCLVGHQKPFIIALWCGPLKDPLSVDDFLQDFIEEFLCLRDGFSFKGRVLKLRIRFFIADAPARAWLRKVNQHGSYFCCERCTVKGEWKFSRMTYDPNIEATLRTDESFKNESQEQYHKGTSTLLQIGILMVTQFPLDIMHLVDLGTTKRLLSMLLKTKGSQFKLPPQEIEKIDKVCELLYHFVPAEFARKPRPISQWSLYKATEFRRLLLYDGFLIFKMQQHSPVYHCFLLLACGMRIFLDSELRSKYAEDAHTLIVNFVSHSYKVFGASFVVYNIHHLIHLFDDVNLHGDPSSFSCYKFENSLGQIKRHLLAPGRTLQQIMCRMLERSLCPPVATEPVTSNKLSYPHQKGPVLE